MVPVPTLNQLEALDKYFAELKIAESTGDRRAQATLLQKIGDIHYARGGWEKALEYYQKWLELEKALKDNKKTLSDAYLNTGKIFWRLAQWTNARKYLLRALDIKQEIRDYDGIARAANYLSGVYTFEGKVLEQAKTFVQKALSLKKKIKDKRILGETYLVQGIIYARSGECNAAISAWKKTLSYLSDSELPELGKAYNNIGVTYIMLGELEKAQYNLEKSLAINRQLNDPYTVTAILNNLSEIFLKRNELRKAEEYCTRSQEFCKIHNDKRFIAQNYVLLGRIYMRMGTMENAEKYLQKGLALATEKELSHEIGISNLWLGAFETMRGETKKAFKYYQTAKNIFHKSGDRYHEGLTLKQIGELYMSEKKTRMGIETLKSALEMLKSVGAKMEIDEIETKYFAAGP